MMLDRAAVSRITKRVHEETLDHRDTVFGGVALPRPPLDGFFAPVEDGTDPEFLRRMLYRSDRIDGPALLFYWQLEGLVGREELAPLVADVWSSAEYPERSLTREGWLSLFRFVGYVSDPPGLPVPTEPVTLYRGAPPRYARGMAWTATRATAQRFADGGIRGRHAGYVYAATVAPAAVLARCEGRGEDDEPGEAEYVVDPSMLPRPVRRAT